MLRSGHLEVTEGMSALSDHLRSRLAAAIAALADAGFSPIGQVEALLADAVEPPPVLLHGDIVGHNLLRHDGSIVMLDPAGVSGPAEFDAARWIARSLVAPGPSMLSQLRSEALAADKTLASDVLDHCLGIELLIEIGYRLTTPAVLIENGAPEATFDDDTQQLVRQARRLLGRAQAE